MSNFTNKDKIELSAATIFEAMFGKSYKIKTPLSGSDQALADIIDEMLNKSLLKKGTNKQEGYFIPTEKGREFYQNQINKISSFNSHYNIFSKVDLGEGSFSYHSEDEAIVAGDYDDLEEFLQDEECRSFQEYYDDNERWDDLRIAVIEFKKLNPYHMVYFGMLSDGSITLDDGWQRRLDKGQLFKPMLEVVETYPNISWFEGGKDEVKNIIESGSKESLRRANTLKEENDIDYDDDDDQEIEIVDHGYAIDPWWGFSFAIYDPWVYYDPYLDPYYYDPYWDRYWW